ncbi:MAG: hypothetical protein ACRCZF_25430 [Gemmataceae bacterium]
MLTFLLLSMTVATTMVALTVLCMMVAKAPAYQVVLAEGYQPTMTFDTAADTIACQRSEGTIAGDWQMAEFSNLRLAEECLDALEQCSTRNLELDILANDKFLVRWR